jgi:hypothetical protein
MRIADINCMYCRLKAELKKLRKMYEEQIKISREEFMMVHSKKVQKLLLNPNPSWLCLVHILS